MHYLELCVQGTIFLKVPDLYYPVHLCDGEDPREQITRKTRRFSDYWLYVSPERCIFVEDQPSARLLDVPF